MISVTNAKYIGLRRVTAISTHSVRVQTHPKDYLGHPPANIDVGDDGFQLCIYALL
jgi:hypothetical protein